MRGRLCALNLSLALASSGCAQVQDLLASRQSLSPITDAAKSVAGQTAARPQTPQTLKEIADFYMPYAAMAARVYDSQGRTEDMLGVAAASSWLRSQLARDPDEERRRKNLEVLSSPERRAELYRNRIARHCAGAHAGFTLGAGDSAVRASEGRCRKSNESAEDDDPDEHSMTDVQRQAEYSEDTPVDWRDCNYRGSDHPPPKLPVQQMTVGWTTVPELQRQLHPRGWSIFVPGLAIDVWRRPRPADGDSPVMEYALVFRGTADGGGWLSNFRALTAFTPVVWDQYRQARVATVDLINQIYQLHALDDALAKRETDTRIKITAVGHSLGGGLANYVFLRLPQITRVVGFDPSPINGSSTFAPEKVDEWSRAKGRRDRQSVMTESRQPLDTPEHFDSGVGVFVLYEKGEILTQLTGCVSGPLWGAEGGPVVRCDGVNLSGGNAVRQHNMPQLACKLFLASEGLPTRP